MYIITIITNVDIWMSKIENSYTQCVYFPRGASESSRFEENLMHIHIMWN